MTRTTILITGPNREAYQPAMVQEDRLLMRMACAAPAIAIRMTDSPAATSTDAQTAATSRVSSPAYSQFVDRLMTSDQQRLVQSKLECFY